MTDSDRDHRLDLLKTIAIVLVLFWHLQPLPVGKIGPPAEGTPITRATEIFYHHISLLAVPTFFTVSLFLFMRKTSLRWGGLYKRLCHLANLFVVWVAVQHLFYWIVTGSIPPLSIDTIKVGGPDLPRVGGSVFYFLFLLIKITAISFVFMKLPQTIRLAVSLLLIASSLLYFGFAPLSGIAISTVSTKNFYVYIAVAYLLLQYRETLIRLTPVFLVSFIASTTIEEIFSQNLFPPYAKPSIVFGVLWLISTIHSRDFKQSRISEWLSRYSLGIFALHKYWQLVFITLFATMPVEALRLSAMPAAMENLLIFLFTLLLTFGSVWLLNRTRCKIYVG